MKSRVCVTCKERKTAEHYSNWPYSKACIACHNENPCKVCGKPAGWTVDRRPRKVCDNPVCFKTVRAESGRAGRAERTKREARAEARRKTRRCSACGEDKPKTIEHFSPARRDPDTGEITRWHAYCRSCHAAQLRDQYQSSAAEREARKARASHYREIERRRRREDPVFDAQVRKRERDRRKATRSRTAPSPQPDNVTILGGQYVPAHHLAKAIDAEAAKYDSRWNHGGGLTAVCERIGVDERRVWDWRSNPQSRCHLGLADKVLIGLDLLWWEVYDETDPDTYEQARRAWEGDEQEAAA